MPATFTGARFSGGTTAPALTAALHFHAGHIKREQEEQAPNTASIARSFMPFSTSAVRGTRLRTIPYPFCGAALI
jgi:hypothetical protein